MSLETTTGTTAPSADKNDNNMNMNTTTTTNTNSKDYCTKYNIPHDIFIQLQAGAFQSLCQHLQDRSDIVQNIDLMTLSGFCRNCLAKWMVSEARRFVDNNNNNNTLDPKIVHALDSMGYDEAAEYVYGMKYDEWKNRYQKKASTEQMEKYNASISIQAKHDNHLLKPRSSSNTTTTTTTTNLNSNVNKKGIESTNQSSSLLSNVCCENVEEIAKKQHHGQQPQEQQQQKHVRSIVPMMYQSPSINDIMAKHYAHSKKQTLKIAIITISDRAYNKQYEFGDLSGPAIQNAIQSYLMQQSKQPSSLFQIGFTSSIVPDDIRMIQKQIEQYVGIINEEEDNNNNNAKDETYIVDLILTTGGTGFSPRDVTPEAIVSMKHCNFIECNGLMNFISSVTSQQQPLSALSRSTAGIINQTTFIVTLPGNPKAIDEIIPILFPLLLQAIADIQGL